ncbi:MAG: thiamine pyrophosphate-dependent enzyme [Dissulfurimicrobium sp.]|uniref:thiamine pyrophosphate-dependent enzyme n=1 Tax=Dissulfurimicrobium TaxID=1769732 RepID=UPI003C71E488
MVDIKDFGEYETAWCPGCGNFGILDALKKALVACGLGPHEVLIVSGIGQAAKTPHYLNVNVFNGLHGRAVPVATGAKLAHPGLTVIAESGDGCMYGEGGNHFISAIRRNIDITMIVHNNQVYGLTKGQASPTSDEGFVTKAQPHGVYSSPFNPLAVAVALDAGFVARGYAGMKEHLTDLIVRAIRHRGFSLVDILQPCVSFNKVNTYAWYKERCRELPIGYDPTDRELAFRTALLFGGRIPLGVIYEKTGRPVFEDRFTALKNGPLAVQKTDFDALRAIIADLA